VDLSTKGGLKIQVSETSLRGNTAFYNPIPKDPKLILNISHAGIAVRCPSSADVGVSACSA
jgi:hypothetical protein